MLREINSKVYCTQAVESSSIEKDWPKETGGHRQIQCVFSIKAPLARLIQNGFTGEVKAGEARKTGFFRLLVHFNPGLQNGFTLQYLDLRKIDEAEPPNLYKVKYGCPR